MVNALEVDEQLLEFVAVIVKEVPQIKLEIAPPAPTIIPAGVEVYVKAASKFVTVADPFKKQSEATVLIVGTAGIGN